MFSIKSDNVVAVICSWRNQYLGNVMKYQKSKTINGRRQFTNEIYIHIQLCSNLIEILKGL